MLGGVNVCRFAGHEVKEAVELDVATGVGVHDGEDTLEVDLTLLVLINAVSKGYQTVLKLFGIEATSSEKLKLL